MGLRRDPSAAHLIEGVLDIKGLSSQETCTRNKRDTRNLTKEVEISATYWPSVEQQATEPRAGEAASWKPPLRLAPP